MGRKMRTAMRTKTSPQSTAPTLTPKRDSLRESPRGRRPADALADPFEHYKEPDDEEEADEEAEHSDFGNGPDDALGVYLRQMGAIPLLNRKQELDLAQKLERHRSRFRRAALCNWLTVARVVETFDRIH